MINTVAALLLSLAGGTVVALAATYLVLLAVASFFHSAPMAQSQPSRRLMVLIPAHNEEAVIERCLSSLALQDYPRHLFSVAVIADNCSDRTAELAERHGSQVLVRTDSEHPGKGRALRWAMDLTLAGPGASLDAFVIVDADSVADARLLRELAAAFERGHDAVQAEYVVLPGSGARGELVAAGFLLFHRVRFSGRAALGLPANLVGNGMLLAADVVRRHPWDAFSSVEDLEYSLSLRLAGVRPTFARNARVSGPVPASSRGQAAQRTRWEGGRFHVLKTRSGSLLRAGLLDAWIDLAVPPLGLLVGLALAGGILVGGAAAVRIVPVWALVPWVGALALVVTFIGLGLLSAGAPRSTWAALLRGPIYLAWKIPVYARVARGFDPIRWEPSERDISSPAAVARRTTVAGVPVDVVDMEEAVHRVVAALDGDRVFQVATVNLDFLVSAHRDPETMALLHASDLNIADGSPVVWLARLSGTPLPGRVAGADLAPRLVEEAAKRGARVFLLGGEDGACAEAARKWSEKYPRLQVAGWMEPARAPLETFGDDAILAAIADTRPDVLLVALGHPKQDKWIARNRHRLTVKVAIGVGCVFDLAAGRRSRAPRIMQAVGLEWLFRLWQEPGRLSGRYATDGLWLAATILRTLSWRGLRGAARTTTL